MKKTLFPIICIIILLGFSPIKNWEISSFNKSASPTINAQNELYISYDLVTNRNNKTEDVSRDKSNNQLWNISTVGIESGNIMQVSMTLDSNDNPHFSYYDYNDNSEMLKYAYWDGTDWSIETADSEENVGGYSSLALDSDNHPHISYCRFYEDSSNAYGLKYAYWDGFTWHNTMIDPQWDGGSYTSLSLDSQGHPHISYCVTNSDDHGLMYSYWNGTAWQIENIDNELNVAWGTSLALDSKDQSHIAYYDLANGDLKYAFYNGTAWHINTIDSIGEVGMRPSIALDLNDNPHISYYNSTNNDLKYANYDGSEWHIETLDSEDEYSISCSIALDSEGFPHIIYFDRTNEKLQYTYHDGSLWIKEGVDTLVAGGRSCSLALDSSDLPHVVYSDHSNEGPKYAFKFEDIEPPILVSDNSQSNGTTGDIFLFNINASDNIEVDAVLVNWIHGDQNGKLNLTLVSSNWTGIIRLSSSVNDLIYTIEITDWAYLKYVSPQKSVTVYDNDPPTIVEDNTQWSASTGEKFEFLLRLSDISGIYRVFVYYNDSIKLHEELLSETSVNIWNCTIIIPDNATFLTYSFIIEDDSNQRNTLYDPQYYLKVIDVITPTAFSGNDRTIEQFQTTVLDGGNCSDNFGIIEYIWNFTYDGEEIIFNETTNEFTFDIPGNYNISLKVIDEEGNWAIDTLNIIVLEPSEPQDIDSDNDTYNDTFELSEGSDPFNPLSTPIDWDADGWNNSVETKVGTNPRNNLSVPQDMDGDSIPDSIDPDKDGDGVANVDDAYPGDSDRWENEGDVDQSESTIYIWVGIVILVSIIAVAVIILYLIKKRKGDEVKQSSKDDLGRVDKVEIEKSE